MKIETTKTIKTSKEIELPYYCTDGVCHAYKVFSEEYCIEVYSGGLGSRIDIVDAMFPFSLQFPETQCTKEVFQKMYGEALAKINEALEL